MSMSNWQQFCLVAVLCGVAFDLRYLRRQRKRRALPLSPQSTAAIINGEHSGYQHIFPVAHSYGMGQPLR
ncbi:hypothetical protein OG21DRAFT_1504486 [Imleria badia]|nr:hypothetical protein OG21DRAFT_1504486 [Imleria badia]